ncbi:uncharacterized protein LOC132312809 [Cornus florida]|uniref:uncharacterized protein LOC132312809 n=1 Tax=Cornus florida TaxID=4283 RepID=UPI00289F67F5|nr:uncharacterized protein LOC132312809 [Cornus florida]XP_059667306.1 uncharacterized protein LOC132312809 [Cornus florida]XP_059667307.1 uncharacterized protein LOC132312809 [Cornus florida]
MARENERVVVCLCRWGGKKETKENGQTTYQGGVTEAFVVTKDTMYAAFTAAVCERFGFELGGKVMYYSTKYDNAQHVRLSSQGGFEAMLLLNAEIADIYIEDAKDVVVTAVPSSPPPHISPRASDDGCGTSSKCDNIVSNSPQNGITDESHRMHGHGDHLIGPGQLFESPSAFKDAVTLFALNNHFAYKYLDCSRKYYRIKCKMEKCPWKITAGCEGGTDIVRVKRFKNVHNHTPQDVTNYKPVIRSKQLGRMIANKVRESPTYLPRQICRDFESDFTVKMSYMQGWRAKKCAREAIDGSLNDDSTSISVMPPEGRRPGRPRNKQTDLQLHDKGVIHCSRCHEAGHNRRYCKAPPE